MLGIRFRRRAIAGPAAATEAPPPEPLFQFRHREHRRNGKRQKRLMWIGLVVLAFFYGLLFTFLPLSFLPFMLMPLGVLVAFVIWALPGERAPPTKLLTQLFFAFFVALIVWPNYLAISISTLPWITFIRLIGVPMALLLFVSLSVSRKFREDLKAVLDSTPWVWKLLALFVLIQLITIPLSGRPGRSISRFAIAQINWTMIFFVACYVFRSPGRVTQWTKVMFWVAIVVIAIGAQEWRTKHVVWAGHIPSFLAVSDEAVQRILAGKTRLGIFYRVQSTFTTSLSFAEYLALTTPFVIHVAVNAKRQMTRLGAMVCVPIVFCGVLMTDSRLGALGFFLSFLMYIAIWGLRRWRSDPKSIMGPAITLGYPLIFSTFIAATLVNLRLYRMVWGGGQYSFSTDARQQQMEMGLPKILHAPWGHGIGEAASVLGFYNPSGLLTIDSYYLTVGLDYGVLGFIAYYGMFVAAMLYGARALFRSKSYETSFLVPAVIALANFVIVKSVLSQEAGHPFAFMLLGLVTALAYRVNLENAAPPAASAA